jgi:diguanylate cyclase (GGDEF)-like protein
MGAVPLSAEPNPSVSSWLCRDDFDRDRMLDMEERVRPLRRRTFAILAVAIAGTAPWLGWWPLLFIVPSVAFFASADRLMPRMSRPEFLMFGAWIGSELMIAGAVALEGKSGLPALCWLTIPVITLSSRFSMRGVVAGVLIAVALTLAVGFVIDLNAVVNSPQLVLAPVTLIVCVAILSVPLMRSDIQHRSDAVIDPLTGMLNRNALSVRVQEIAQQSAVTNEPVGLVIGDIDHFKDINDTHGHSVGDTALKEVAYMLRKQLRAFDLAYRLGGEEFLILLPGSDIRNAENLAERLRARVGSEQVAGGIAVTMSFGVGASSRDEAFDYAAVFARADAALYEAKRNGRDRVCLAEPSEARVPAAALA